MPRSLEKIDSLNLLESVVESIPLRVFWKDRSGNYLGCNTLFAKDSGFSTPQELIGKDDFAMGWKDQADLYRSDDFAVMESGMARLGYEEPQTTPAGETIWLRTSKVPLRDEGGEIIGILGIYEDITQQKHATEQWLQSEQRFSELFEQASDGVFIADRDGRYTDVNSAGCAMLGFERDEIVGKTIMDLVPESELTQLAVVKTELQKGAGSVLEWHLLRKDGSYLPVEVSARILPDGRWQGFVRDISERRVIEDELRITQFALDHAPDAVFWMKPDGSFIYVNEEACNRLGYSREELLNMGVADIDPGLPGGVTSEMAAETQKSGLRRLESVHKARDGHLIPVDILVSYINYDGRDYHCSFARDISDIKQKEEGLRREAAFRAQLLEQAAEGICLWHLVDSPAFAEFLVWNRQMEKITGYTQEEINRLGWLDVIYADDVTRSRARKKMLKVIDGEVNRGMDFEAVAKSGEKRILNISSARVRGENEEPCVLAVIQDVTEHRQHQRMLEESRKRFQMLFDSTSDGQFILDMEGGIIDVNRRAHEQLGYTRNELMAMKLTQLDPPEFAARVPERLGEIMARGEAMFESAHYRKDGSIMPVEISSRIIELDDEQVIFSVIRDISERKQLEEQLRQSQKLEAIGTLVGGIAHDFNNMLAAVLGNIYLARQQVPDHPAVNEKLENIERLGTRSAEMVQQLLTFARKDSVEMEVFELNTLLQEGFTLAKALIPESIDHRCDICDETLYIKGSIARLQQVMMNLLNNAVDAVSGAAVPEIRCRLDVVRVDRALRKQYPEVQGEHLACLCVSDNGIGIPEDQLDKIFEPFFTTKEVGRGTGLGLSMVYGAVQSHGGFVDVKSEIGSGTTFRVYLPLYENGGAVHEMRAVAPGRAKGETILLVDDAVELLETTRDVLTSMGYRLLTAADGEEGIAMFRQNAADIDLVITDVIMPRVGGMELYRAVREVDRQMPVIFTTGYDKNHVLDTDEGEQQTRVVIKPFNFDELSHSIQSLIGS